MNLTVAEIARRLNGLVEGNGEALITGLSGIREAQAGQLTFIATPRYAITAGATKATAVIVAEDWNRPCSATLIRVKNPDKAFAEVAQWFAPPPIVFKPARHPTAVIAGDAQLGNDVFIGPHCVVESGAIIGNRCVLVAACYIGHGTVIGDDCKFYPHVTLREYAQIGNRVIIHNGAVIGSDGFGYVQEGAVRKKIPQIGIVAIGDDVEIGANVTIDRARFGQTRIGNGVKIDNLVQIAHNVIIGDNAVVVAQVGISGSTCVGERTILAGQVGIAGHLVIGSDVIAGAQAGISKDIPSGTFVLGSPAYPYDKATKIFAHTARLPELKAKVAAMEERIAKLEQKQK
ncbi:MAG: UDP-3-O-(3-hydroxymyristoyl)glucosamine N-acyltransferase [Verrucomicrobia bacterium]|nr:UDP-3-O-(3-hydroxymyristoyl)glucosamine N-acyltransferase [Verrucomicrobiota bacterium]MBU4246791.1 UDP-3-O-(3-hydroxymyristoyl)glucosamine N-acyltransferase [Verrucomicrobiota bacterium]MBU4290575.1 UDP-3-O-(3-hydroxymyristoyl)glucosamine N-acyltransferase [Verrucomicrobiota bacterium]MBU4496599.1 UDP-3-O-(3-hydroxymyristoyl)glucosamine N-acyltransferase [Verrucomicrobiota bacterium]MCG2681209.1 UDP-3-O-(3-hydroxymyristoyl)glucosamine N-acyltransferase [Kiritimatiellia bacterium]